VVSLLLAACEPGPDPVRNSRASDTRLPNIIFILTDDLGWGDLGSYGQQQVLTPSLDRMAAEGMRFTQFYAGSTVCAPSRSVLMTGQHTGRTHVRGNLEIQPMGQEPLPDSVVTVAEILKDAGYTTGLIGKWGLGGPETPGEPNRQGFDYFFGYLCQRHAHNFYPEFLFRNSERVPLPGNRVAEPRPDGAGVAVERGEYSHDLLAADALTFIERNRNRPFFLYLALTIPHANNEAGDEGMEVPDYGIYANRSWSDPEKGFAAMVTRMDRDVGRIVDRLQELGIDQHTILFFASDNGPHQEGGRDPEFFRSSGPLRGIKRDLYEGGIRVPFIARWAGRIRPGTTSEHIGDFTDFMATASELAGLAPPEGTDGVSLLPTLLGQPEAQRQRDYLYWEFYERGSGQAVRAGRWKAVRHPMRTGPIELYDLEADLSEQNDLAREHPDVVAEMRRVMREAHVPSPLWQPRGSRQ
jgi:arylsulfatase A-like enzyme